MRNFPTWFFELNPRKASLVGSLVITFAFVLVRMASANDSRSFLMALAMGVAAFGLALVLYVDSTKHHEKVEAWRAAQQKQKVADLKTASADATGQNLTSVRSDIDQIMQYLATRRMLNFDREATAHLAGAMAADGYLNGIAKNKARFAPGKDF